MVKDYNAQQLALNYCWHWILRHIMSTKKYTTKFSPAGRQAGILFLPLTTVQNNKTLAAIIKKRFE